MLEYLASSASVDCGTSDPIVLEFHHVCEMRDRRLDVSRLVTQGYIWKRVEEELAKCIVLCANCHRIRTTRERGHYRARHPLTPPAAP